MKDRLGQVQGQSRRRRQRDVLLPALLAALLALPELSASACALAVAPPRTEVSLPPGGRTTAIITVANPDQEAYEVELSEKPWFKYPDNQRITVPDWLKLPRRTHFKLNPGKNHEIKITLECPKDAVGELMGMVSVAYQGMTPSMITPMISTAVYLRVLGTEKNLGDFLALTAVRRNGAFQVLAKIKATGNVRLIPSGGVQLLDNAGKTVAVYRIPEGQPLFPSQEREYLAQGPSAPPPAGRYRLVADINSGTLNLKAERGFEVKPDGSVQMDAVPAPDAGKEAPKP